MAKPNKETVSRMKTAVREKNISDINRPSVGVSRTRGGSRQSGAKRGK